MADRRTPRTARLDQPREAGRRLLARPESLTEEAFGVLSEKFARFMGTPYFLLGMTVFVVCWVLWNLLAPESLRFDDYPFIFLTLMLSLQASYAAPLILLAQNRQADRDRVMLEQDRSRDERNLADTEFLTREVAALRLAMRDNATRDFIRGELRDLVEEMAERSLVVARVEPDGDRAAQPSAGPGAGATGPPGTPASTPSRGSPPSPGSASRGSPPSPGSPSPGSASRGSPPSPGSPSPGVAAPATEGSHRPGRAGRTEAGAVSADT